VVYNTYYLLLCLGRRMSYSDFSPKEIVRELREQYGINIFRNSLIAL